MRSSITKGIVVSQDGLDHDVGHANHSCPREKHLTRLRTWEFRGYAPYFEWPKVADAMIEALLANLFQGSRTTLSGVSFPSVLAFQAGMWGIPISALLNSLTVTHEQRLSTAYENSLAIFSRVSGGFPRQEWGQNAAALCPI